MKILFITLEQSGRQIVKSILDDNFFKINKNQIFTFGMNNSYLEFNDLTNKAWEPCKEYFEEIKQIPFNTLNDDFEIILAYEPIWAIGTGETASIGHINEIHSDVKSKLSKLGLNIPILYGGSVNPSNCKEILASDNVDGVLVGGASTKYDLFKEIVNSI